MPSTSQSSSAGISLMTALLGTTRKMANTTTMATRLCASTKTLRMTTRAACSESGMRCARIMPSAALKEVAPSPVSELRNCQETIEIDKNGR